VPLWVLVSAALAAGTFPGPPAAGESVPFTDDFEHGLDRWEILGVDTARLVPSGDPAHGTVLELVPNGDAAVLIRGSESWPPVRLEAEMRFLSDVDSYLGLIYHHVARGARRDFGLIYIKGDDSYLQVNPHRDFNVSRLIYPELHVDLTGDAAVTVGVWKTFAIEVEGSTAHVYIGDGSTPQLTFSAFESTRGAMGLQPRSVGGPVWVDRVRVRRLDKLSYTGPPIPARAYVPQALLTDWQVAGPFDRTDDDFAQRPARHAARWRPFATDSRGAVVTGRVVDYHGAATVAYFRTVRRSPEAREAELRLSTVDDVAVWLNGRFQSFVARQDAAWFDFRTDAEHRPRRVPVDLQPGANDLVIRVRGGVYASGGFFASLEEVSR
jgi:hypothetical protein